jgi:nitrate reductase NapE component
MQRRKPPLRDMDKAQFTPLLAAWIAILVPLVVISWRSRSVGLVAAYCFQMWMFYWLGTALHAFPWSELDEDEAVFLGFQQATYAVAAFAAGALLLGPLLGRFVLGKMRPEPSGAADSSIPRRYTICGLIAYFVLAPTIGRLPGMNAIPAVASQLVVIGCCLQCWLAWHLRGRTALLRSLGPSMLIPLVILMKQGFMSYGVLAMSVILLFIAQFYRPRWAIAALLVVSAYPGLTVFVNYMRDRNDIRAAVWGGEEVTGRMAQIWQTATNMQWFNPKDPEQLERIDGRLNQATLVGEAVDNLSHTDDFAHGSTIKDAVLAMIPRLIWPDKPPSGGSGDLAARFTGKEFAVGTSVGIGPVLEFYGNFGTAGVVVGFFILGIVIRALDICAGTALWNARWGQFALFYLIGISSLNVAGSLVEVSAGSAASFVVATAVRKIFGIRAVPRPVEAAA